MNPLPGVAQLRSVSNKLDLRYRVRGSPVGLYRTAVLKPIAGGRCATPPVVPGTVVAGDSDSGGGGGGTAVELESHIRRSGNPAAT